MSRDTAKRPVDYPFGETRLSTGMIFTDKLFTGQREMAGLGIYHYNARFYSPKLGRFLSADTIVPNPINPQDLNRFGYVRNSPLRYVDPTGHDPSLNKCDYYGGSYCNSAPATGGGGNGGGGGVFMPTVIHPTAPPLLPTTTVPSTGTPPDFTASQHPNCSSCIITGGAILVALGALELSLLVASVAAVVLSGPEVIPALAIVGLPIEAAIANIALIGLEEIKQGVNRPAEDVHIDYLPLVHLVTNTDEGEYFK